MAMHPPHPCMVHPLPPAPHFVGRDVELAELRGLWQTGVRGVRALLGLGYQHVDVGGLGPAATRALLRAHGVWGDDATLDGLAEAYGAHALTLDHLGALVGRFLGGDPHRAPEAPALTTPGSDRQAL